jgi:adenosylhomocysteine nucleosidase
MIAFLSAMHEEIAAVVQALTDVTTREYGGRHFHVGRLHDTQTVVVFSRYGKVAAASTMTQLIASYPVERVIFTGVAGAVRPDLNIGDVVVATDLIQHDMDASPLFPRYEVPLLRKALFATDPALRDQLTVAANTFLADELPANVAPTHLQFFNIQSPRVLQGVIASGDKFFASAAEVAELRQRLPAVACVEMEGAAVAQVCDEYRVPFAVVRTISDSADEHAVHDFPRFSREIAGHYCVGILSRFIRDC